MVPFSRFGCVVYSVQTLYNESDPMAEATRSSRMQCMEVWGGNAATERTLSLVGLDIFVLSQPFRGAAAGGDIHYISACGSGRVTRTLVADVSGHGDAVAQVADTLRNLIHRFVNYIDQRKLVQAMNARFCAYFRDGLFATALIATYFAPTRKLTISNAGHPPPLLFRVKTGEWSYIYVASNGKEAATDLPLGIDEDMDYHGVTVTLEPGDLVLCYTDPLLEMQRDGQIAGRAGLLAFMNQLPKGGQAVSVIPAVLDGARRSYESLEDSDDLTLVLLQCSGQSQRASMREVVAGTARWMRQRFSNDPTASTPFPWPEWSVPNVLGAVLPWFNRFWRP